MISKKQIAKEWLILVICVAVGFTVIFFVDLRFDLTPTQEREYYPISCGLPWLIVSGIRSVVWSINTLRKD
jgi:UDP-N-acetylmuramyl pentapeptide phosphotransferase/UDP-N-acetylglucosamine-1-phosphate transferase